MNASSGFTAWSRTALLSTAAVGDGSAQAIQENPNAWDFSNVTSQANFLDIEPASPIITAIATRTGILFWTGKKAYISSFLGIPYVYDYVELAANCTPWSPKSVVTTSSMAVWVSQQGAFSFDGTSILPVQCMVRAFVDDVVDLLNVREQACAAHVAAFNEVWWFFPVRGSTTNTNCVIYNYKDGWWSMGWMPRSAGMISSYTSPTIMADGLVAYKHETGSVYPANVPLPWAETFDLNLNSGSRLTTVKQMMPDIETIDYPDAATAIGNLRYSLFYRNSLGLSALLNCRRRRSRCAVMVMSTSALQGETSGCESSCRGLECSR